MGFCILVFGVKWVMPKTMKGVLQGWGRSPNNFRNRVWNVVPGCFINVSCMFEGRGI